MKGTFEIDMSCFADIGYTVDKDGNGNDLNICGWAFQTIWGDEIAVRITISKKHKLVEENTTHAIWNGIMEIKGTKSLHLERLKKDADRFLYALTSGLLRSLHESDEMGVKNILDDTLLLDFNG